MPRTPWSSPSTESAPRRSPAAAAASGSAATAGDQGAAEESSLQKNRNRYEFVPNPRLPPESLDSAEGDGGASCNEATDGAASIRPMLNLSMLKNNGGSSLREGGHRSGMRSSASMDSLGSLESISASHRNSGDMSTTGLTGRFSDTASMASFALSSAERSLPEGCIASLPPVPACFRCPVSQQIMEDPVYLEDGRCVERANVSRLGYKGQVQPNDSLREAIKGYFELRSHSERQQQEWQDYLALREQRAAQKLLIRQRQVHGLRLALERGRRKVQEMKAQRPVSCSPTLSMATEVIGSDSVTPSPQRDQDEAACKDALAGTPEPEPHFKSGPAPRADAAAITAARQQRLQRKSTWSSGKLFTSMRG